MTRGKLKTFTSLPLPLCFLLVFHLNSIFVPSPLVQLVLMLDELGLVSLVSISTFTSTKSSDLRTVTTSVLWLEEFKEFLERELSLLCL